VDNSWWTERAAQADCRAVRAAWDLADVAPVVLFCAKLQPWKGPADLLEGFARANVPNLHLVFAGEGPLKPELKLRAKALGVSERVRFLGFVNQSQLPSVYGAADLFVLPSLYEPFGLVINEAMLCGCPVAISDRVGAKFDLVREGENGYVFPAEDVGAISAVLEDFFADPTKRIRMSAAARERMRTWSPREYMNGLVEAVELAARARK
jgi:glycosyltransferase involved in cell wall biosynthesis